MYIVGQGKATHRKKCEHFCTCIQQSGWKCLVTIQIPLNEDPEKNERRRRRGTLYNWEVLRNQKKTYTDIQIIYIAI